MNHFNIPLLNPFKFVPDTDQPGVHFDERWAFLQVRDQEQKIHYLQKWVLSDTTRIQIESSVALPNMNIIDVNRQVVKTIPWGLMVAGTNYNIYELLLDISDIPENIYFLTQQVTLAGVTYSAITEPIWAKVSWPNTRLITYTNSYNDWGTAFTTGIKFKFRVEADIPPNQMQFLRDRATAVTQSRNVVTLSGTPYRQYKLFIGGIYGTDKGVAPWVIDLINRIFVCDYIDIDGRQFQSTPDSKFEMWSNKGMPTICAAIDIVEAVNKNTFQFNELGDIDPLQDVNGIIVAYNIDTGFFGPGTLIPITNIEKH
jgi:hypothetical protein